MTAALEAEATPPSPFRLPRFGGEDRVLRIDDGVASRLLLVDNRPVLVRAWQPRRDAVRLRAEPLDPAALLASAALPAPEFEPAGPAELRRAIERMRFALGVDDDLSAFFGRFRRDPLLGPLLRRRPYLRPVRRPRPWEALAWAVVKQLIESERAALIQRRIVGRWGTRTGPGRSALRDVPDPATIAGRAPAELAALDLSPGRALALRAAASEVAAGRIRPGEPGADRRLLRIREIGPWTIQCLGLLGRGEPDSLPAGDLIFIKLVGRLANLGRRATVAEVEEFYAPYAPYRGLAGLWTAGFYR